MFGLDVIVDGHICFSLVCSSIAHFLLFIIAQQLFRSIHIFFVSIIALFASCLLIEPKQAASS